MEYIAARGGELKGPMEMAIITVRQAIGDT